MNARIGTIDTPLMTVTAATLGSGPALVYLHDVLFDMPRPDGADVPDHLQALGVAHSIIAPWLPGFRDLAQLKAVAELDDYLFVLTDFLAAASPARPHLVGAGLGGWLAAELAVRRPDKIATLTLVNAFGLKVDGHPTARFFDAAAPNPLGGRREIRELLFTEPDGELATKVLPDFPDSGPGMEFFTNVHAAAQIGWSPPAFYDPKLTRHLHRIDVPTQIVWGAANKLVDLAHAEAFVAGIEGATLHVIDGAGHLLHVERPGELAATIIAHTSQHAS